MMTQEQRQWIQVLAGLTMLIDHIGAIFFPQIAGFRVIGRVSFPLFAFGIAQGVKYTANFNRYLLRLLLAAIFSQPIYCQLFGNMYLNPLFTMAGGAGTIHLWKKGKKKIAILLLFCFGFLPISYGWYGVWTIFVFAFYEKHEQICFYMQLVLNVLYGWFSGIWMQAISLCSFWFLDRKWHLNGSVRSIPRYFFYIFYPLHLLILWEMKMSI